MRRESRFSWKAGAVGLIALVILSYTYYKTKDLIEGPSITVFSPENGAEVSAPVIAVTGTTKNIAKITLNGHPISVDETGAFYEETAIPEGYTILSVEGEDRFGKKKEVTLSLVRKAPAARPEESGQAATGTETSI